MAISIIKKKTQEQTKFMKHFFSFLEKRTLSAEMRNLTPCWRYEENF